MMRILGEEVGLEVAAERAEVRAAAPVPMMMMSHGWLKVSGLEAMVGRNKSGF